MRTSERQSADEPSAADDAEAPARTRRLGALGGLARSVGRLRTPEADPEPYVRGETRLGARLTGPALIGALGSLMVLWGASQPTSPFTLNHATETTLPVAVPYPLWYFGAGRPVGNVLVGVVVVYAGMFLTIRAWLALARLSRRFPGTPLRYYVGVLLVWVLPLLVVAPLFSHDAFSYVAQGEEMTRRINPYLYPPQSLGPNANPYASLVDHWWNLSTSPYGPVFLGLAGAIVEIVNHNELLALLGFRFIEVLGLVLLCVYVPRLARSYGRDGTQAFVLVALNPIVLFHLVAGEHNDALMMGLLVAGLALAREGRPVAGIILCVFAGLVKVPAVIGVVYIGWDWAGVGVPWRRRVKPLARALVIGSATLVATTYAIGIGWDWVKALVAPGSVSSWMDPGTGIGGLIGRLVSGLGLGEHTIGITDVAHGIGLAAAAVIAIWLLFRSDGDVRSLWGLGLTLLAVVVLGPAIQPWYLSWGIITLVPVATGRARAALIWLSAIMSFLGLPGGKMLVAHIQHAGAGAVLAAIGILVLVGLGSFAPRIYGLVETARRGRSAALPGAGQASAGGSLGT